MNKSPEGGDMYGFDAELEGDTIKYLMRSIRKDTQKAEADYNFALRNALHVFAQETHEYAFRAGVYHCLLKQGTPWEEADRLAREWVL